MIKNEDKEERKEDNNLDNSTNYNKTSDNVSPVANSSNTDSVLRKWLDGEYDLITWLDESTKHPGTDTLSSTPAAIHTDSLPDLIASYESEITHLKNEILELKGEQKSSAEEEYKKIKEDYEQVTKELERLTNENARLRRDLENAEGRIKAIKSRLEEFLAGVPVDQAEILKKAVELDERERAILERESTLAKVGVASDAVLKTGALEEIGIEDRFHAELLEKENEFRRREQELMARIQQLEEEVNQKSIENKLLQDEIKIAKLSAPEAKAEIEEKLKDLKLKERSLLLRDEEIRRLKEQLQEKDEELQKLKSMITYKEEELIRREEDILYREKLLTEERRRFDDAKRDATSIEEHERLKRLEDLKAEIQRKEEELRAKEKFLNAKMEELRLREQGIIEDEIAAREEQRALEMQQQKVKTGNPRLDDLLLGGIPFGSNVLIHGPPFIGKEVMVNQFIAEGLKKGIPAIWILTDKGPNDVREEMKYVMSGYEEYERLGLVRYVDSYSRSMGDTSQDPYVTYIEEPTDHDGIMDAVEKIAKEFKEKHEYYRLAFRSISTLIAYSDINTAFRFLSPFCGRRKRDKAVSLYVVEKGMHSEQEIQMMGSIMDGMIDFKVDQLKTYFAVIGICEVQSRAYIRYTASKSGLTIGSFALEHIR